MTSGLRHDAADVSKARDAAPAAQRGPSHVTGALAALERIPTVVLDDHQAVAILVAQRIAGIIRERNAEGRAAVLGLATGSTPIGVYRELIRMHHEEGLSFTRVVSFNLDEYYPMAPDNIHSYHRFMWENLFSQVDVDPANVHIPDGTVPRTFTHRSLGSLANTGPSNAGAAAAPGAGAAAPAAATPVICTPEPTPLS